MSNSLTLAPAPRSEAAEQVRAEVREFLAAELAAGTFETHVDTWLSGVDPAFSRKLGERGWLGMTWPKQYGGHERSAMERYAVTEELLAAGAPVAAHWIADRQSGPNLLTLRHRGAAAGDPAAHRRGRVLLRHRDERARLRLRPRLDPHEGGAQRGRRLGGQRRQGVDVERPPLALRDHAGAHLAARTPRNRHAGMSQLLVDLSLPGITINPIRILDGGHHFNEVVFEDVVVPGDMLLGEEGNGWHQVTAELAFERSGPERFLSTYPLVAEFARRVADSGDPAALATLGRLSARLLALRQLSLRIAAALDRGELPNIPAALVKDVGTTFEGDVIEEIRRVVDVTPSLDSPDPLGRALAEAQLHAPGYTLRGGTNEILRGIVARGLGLR